MKKLNEEMNISEIERQSDDLADMLYESIKINGEIDEGILGKLVGGAAGFLVGPAIGKTIARVLGVKSGLLYDLLTSKLVTTALGISIAKSVSK